jgi:hypothetical protein
MTRLNLSLVLLCVLAFAASLLAGCCGARRTTVICEPHPVEA